MCDGCGEEFTTEVRLNRTTFRDGENVVLSVRASQAARLYVVAVSEVNAVILIPNRHMPETIVEAGTWLHFPNARLTERGVGLRAKLPDGQTHAEETLIVIALRGAYRLESPVPASGTTFATESHGRAAEMLSHLLAPLTHFPPTEWTFDDFAYTIQPR